ncbi:U4/U6-U5 snRNP complex subunit lsm8 [Coemansia sp. RSA 1822]|nr:U4/U6-U5 snRNP complex subunit lsm8 [Coemansia sp. RSA 638]KAJ2124740.1 U4/U6-U5 snRNP complex subunit lsm8 [Coemansia sp. RSA 720]KAJ2483783.1 U4/U6-U5 snRNP complex subunit lsm8 [Coemansia sp. RSA 2131]KAJ2545410.1 U4/U6-U5 snRNP complex subunit lsm8 [Coemansia sp. RSA 1853]KAJ2567582.1 U4/U6-U5 snRNP complex subunit lsm8 [Coemansia sp. RSA 1822]KAJ2666710.1 U4/U6-U5 snRNP complex subunit lsm8 [Coemansia sp. RSA 1199]
MSQLQPYVNQKVSVIMNDGRIVVGTLRGLDQTTNIIMQNSQERIFSEDEGVEVVDLGLYLIRGDNIAVIGLVDEELDGALDLENLKGEPLPSLKH